MCPCTCPSRRRLLLGGGAAALYLPFSGCVEGGSIGLVSDAQVTQMGLQSWQQITSQTPVSTNGSLVSTSNQVAGRLLAAAGENRSAWEVRVFRGNQINAFTLPGKKIGIYEGMFSVARTPDQLAAVLGHEIGHLAEDHGSDRINTEVATDLGIGLVERLLAAGEIGGAREIAGALGVGVEYGLIRPYSRRQELEADAYGLRLMDRAGYDPREAITLWQRMEQSGRGVPELISTHPAPATRIEEMRALIDQLA